MSSKKWPKPIFHVLHILGAEFDVDSGAVIKHQYPSSIPGDQNLIAELMLPDQIHERKEDWTIFFFYRQRKKINLEYHISSIDSKLGAHKYYGLNLTNSVNDVNANRGSVVKSICIITPHPFFHIFKPLLMLSLDEYFISDSVDTLKHLYDAINSLDLTHMPKFNTYERRILSARTERDIFIERFQSPDAQYITSKPKKKKKSPSSSVPPIASPENKKSTSAKKYKNKEKTCSYSQPISKIDSAPDSSVKSKSSSQKKSQGSAHNDESKSKKYSKSSKSPSNIKSDVKKKFNNEQPNFFLDLKNNGQRLVSQFVTRDTHFFETRVNFKGKKIPLKVPTNSEPEQVGDFSMLKLLKSLFALSQPFNIHHEELTIYGPYTPPILVLINGLLTQKRILILDLKKTAGEVSDHVLATCFLGSGGILRSFITSTFPYTDLSKAEEFTSCPGYIAGAKNPIIARRSDWWDILIDLGSSSMRISPNIAGGSNTNTVKESEIEYFSNRQDTNNNGYPINCNENWRERERVNLFFSRSLAAVTNQADVDFLQDLKGMVDNHFADSFIRTRCSEYTRRFIRITTSYEELNYGKSSFWPSHNKSSEEESSTSSMSNPNDDENEGRDTGKETSDPILGHGYVWADELQRTAEFKTYEPVIEGWRKSKSYECYVSDCKRDWPASPKIAIDYEYHIDMLSMLCLGDEKSADVYLLFADNIQSNEDISMFLATAGSSSGSFYEGTLLHYVALGMLHPSSEVRDAVVGLIWRVRNHSAGRYFYTNLNRFFLMTFDRLLPQFLSRYGLLPLRS